MPGLEEFGITPKRASHRELEEALITVQTQVASPMVKTLLCHIAALTEERAQLAVSNAPSFRSKDHMPIIDQEAARAVAKHNCSNTMTIQADRVGHFVRRMRERGDDPDEVVIVLISVDSCTYARSLADTLMPDHDWQAYRDRGEVPCARGLAVREGIQAVLDGFDPEAARKLAAIAGRVAVVVFNHGVAEVFEP